MSAHRKPLVLDLFCGLGGWSSPFIAEGYRAVGFDIEAHDYGSGNYPGEFVLRDIRSITGAGLVNEFGVPTIIVASPPCQEFSYMAMPWSKAKEKQRKIEANPAEQKRLTDLFNQCFRIQREVSEACGHYVPMIVENVRGAQKWVGKAKWNFGSFYLWGDVPALLPIPGKSQHGQKLPPGNTTSPLWSERPISRLADALKGEGCKGVPPQPAGQWTNAAEHEDGTKAFKDSPIAALGSKSNARKRASAEIAKIPPALAAWIAKVFKKTE